MFPNFFHIVLRCLIHVNHQNRGLPLKFFEIIGKIAYFMTLMRNRPNCGPGSGPDLCDQTSHEKHASTLHILCFVGLTCLVWWGKIKKFGKKILLGYCWIAQSMAFIFSYSKWLSSKIQGFSDHNSWTVDPNFMFLGANRIVLMRLTHEKKTKSSKTHFK